jgi:hypothetical protein
LVSYGVGPHALHQQPLLAVLSTQFLIDHTPSSSPSTNNPIQHQKVTNMRYSTALVAGMAAFTYAQSTSSFDALASFDSAASSELAAATDESSLLAAVASSAFVSFQQAYSTLDPAARASVSSIFDAYGLDFNSVTSALNDPLATGSSSSDSTSSSGSSSGAQSTGSSAESTSPRTTGSSAASAAQTSASTTGSEGMAAATALPIAAIGAGLALIGML